MQPESAKSTGFISLTVKDDAHVDTVGAVLLAITLIIVLFAYMRAQRRLHQMAERVARLEAGQH